MAQLELENLEALRALEGRTLPVSDWLTVTQEMINDFAKATMDFQWIHIDVEKANKHSPYKKPIAHGYMSVSLLPKLLGDILVVKSVKMGVNYGLNKVRFPHPVLVDSKLRLKAGVQKLEAYGDTGLKVSWECVLEIKGEAKPACVANIISLMFE